MALQGAVLVQVFYLEDLVVLVEAAQDTTKLVSAVVLELQIKVMMEEQDHGQALESAAEAAAKMKQVILMELGLVVTDYNGMMARRTLAVAVAVAVVLALVALVVAETEHLALMIMQVVLNQVQLTQAEAVEEIHLLVLQIIHIPLVTVVQA